MLDAPGAPCLSRVVRQQVMSVFTFEIAPVVLLAWLVWTPLLIFAMWQCFGSHGSVIQLLSYNAIVLGIFCGFWYLGFYISEYWMRIDRKSVV